MDAAADDETVAPVAAELEDADADGVALPEADRVDKIAVIEELRLIKDEEKDEGAVEEDRAADDEESTEEESEVEEERADDVKEDEEEIIEEETAEAD